jgi:subtilisin family serine protease
MAGVNGVIALLLGALLVLSLGSSSYSAYGANNNENASGSGGPKGVVPGHYIVVIKDGESAEGLARAHGVVPNVVFKSAVNGFAGPASAIQVESLKNDPRVKYIENDQWVSAFAQTTPTGIKRIGADENPISKINGVNDAMNVDIAIIDTGVDATHPDLNVFRAVDCTVVSSEGACQNGGTDGNGHGTHVAGTAAAIDNGQGVVGVSPGARIWSAKVLGNNGSGWMSWIVAGVNWVTANANEIEVANMSLGCECSSPALDEAIANSVSAGVTYVVAAGNSGKNASTFSPANHPDVITVSAMVDTDGKCGSQGPSTNYGIDDTFASFSNFGDSVDIVAPGVSIYSTYKTGSYATLSGTSMASPHVAGAATIYQIANPGATPSQVKSGLISSGVSQALTCDPTVSKSYGGLVGSDPDSKKEPLAYLGSGEEKIPLADTTAPSITSGPTVSEVTSSSAKVSWTTDEASTTVVYYKQQADTSWTSVIDNSATTTHSLILTALNSGTSYYYYVSSADAAGNVRDSAQGTFTTASVADTPKLAVSAGNLWHELKGKSGSAKLFLPVTVTGTAGSATTLNVKYYQSASLTGEYTLVAQGSVTTSGDGTLTFEYSRASCGNYYYATASATAAGTAVSATSTTYRIACS